ncbi:MAG: 30S ribosomal protein S4 [Dehalococcoidales bacterium]|jgi:small subunit ribosomal protein S4|nr:30S ribosomal protein S4 [Dehalococcoidales bacterium]MDD3994233.1 30S ribosomal protein S4 [Dehalococcoidales bacterium]NLT28210.1 30S ribosomal protein S4 [Dehalococcoidales bacterium]
MARYTEAVCRLCRRSGEKLMLKGSRCITKCTLDKRPKAPGPQLGRRRRISDRGEQLREKQKVRYSYGVLERQFRKIFAEAERKSGITGENLLVLLERRLDNVVYRLGFADSRAQARQLVQHGHFDLNGKKTDIPSCFVKEGDVISWHGSSVKSEYFKTMSASLASKTIPGWLNLDKEKAVGKVLSLPTPDDIEAKYNIASVVEYYSR